MRRALFLSLVAGCATPRPPKLEPAPRPPAVQRFPRLVDARVPGGPLLRVGIGTRRTWHLIAPDTMWVNRVRALPPGKYRVRVRGWQRARARWFVMVARSPDSAAMARRAQTLVDSGYPASVRVLGHVYAFARDTVDMREWAVMVGPYASAREAKARGPMPGVAVVRLPEAPPRGQIQLVDARGRVVARAEGALELWCTGGIWVLNVPKGTETEPKGSTKRVYPGVLEFSPAPYEKGVLLVNRLRMEDYVRGVLPEEMGPGFPLEALKAQAVLARTHALNVMGRKYLLLGLPYELTDGVFTQVYAGLTHSTPRTDSAVRQTQGYVLIDRNGRIPWAVFHSCCGGSLEGAEIWGKSLPHLYPHPDWEGSLSLASEEALRRFVDDPPPEAYCNPKTHRLPIRVPFRWRRKRSKSKIREAVRRETGRDPGPVQDLVILSRSAGGRVKELLVRGRRDLVIKGELQIRRAMGNLPSALFYIVKTKHGFVFRGAGFGHGAGMCQMGAAGMASEGKTFTQILLHYFNDVRVEKVY